MTRRGFLLGLSGVAVTSSFAVRAQQDRPPRIAILLGYSAADLDGQALSTAFRAGLRELGWQPGRNMSLEFRWYDGEPNRAKALAKELLALSPDILVANSTIGLDAVRAVTRTIPIIFVAVSDPVAAGYAESVARPGGNITGFASFDADMGGKWLGLLKEVAPALAHVAVLMDPDFAGYRARWDAIEQAGMALGLHMRRAAVRASSEIESAMATVGALENAGLVVFSSAITSAHRIAIVELAAQHSLPAVYPFKSFVMSGGLMSYGIDRADLFRRSAAYVDRIVRGEYPGTLPIQSPTKFEFVLNLKAAKALNLTIPPTLLARADEVIE